jgi:hypothetical protein
VGFVGETVNEDHRSTRQYGLVGELVRRSLTPPQGGEVLRLLEGGPEKFNATRGGEVLRHLEDGPEKFNAFSGRRGFTPSRGRSGEV